MGIPTLRQLITDLETSYLCESLGLKQTPFSTMKDGFTRFPSKFFEKLYQHVLRSCHWVRLPVDFIGLKANSSEQWFGKFSGCFQFFSSGIKFS